MSSLEEFTIKQEDLISLEGKVVVVTDNIFVQTTVVAL